MKLNISIKGDPGFRQLVRDVGALGRHDLHRSMGVSAQALTIEYLQALAQVRHATANALGAQPTGYYGERAERVALAVSDEAAEITIDHPGISRAFHDVTITAKTAKFLAIPIHAIAYGRRARYLWAQLGLFIPKGCNYIAMKTADGKGILKLYLLVRSVTQKQDRTLLPSDEMFEDAAVDGAKSYLRRVNSKGGLA